VVFAPGNISKKTGERLYRTICKLCEKERKDIWRSNNLEKHNAKAKQWVQKNLEKRTNSSKLYYSKNKELCSKLGSIWKKENKNKINLYTQMRRRRLKISTPQLNEFDKLFILEIYHLAQLRGLEVDHIIPLTHKLVCGLHVPENLQLLTKSENSSKGNKWLST
jgi:5-methylcytosine-specific restriction endonuclease McrA